MPKLMAYTAFDGDQMIYIDSMRELAIRNGYIPINPEHALGYYLCTHSHENSKAEVMKDCLTLVTISNELWIFTQYEDAQLHTLPEGVLIEILFWCRRRSAPIRFFSIEKMMRSLGRNGFVYTGKPRSVSENDILTELGDLFFKEITNFLKQTVGHLRPTVFIDIRNEDYKYVDWIRISAYDSNFVPIVPQHLIPESVYNIHGIEEEQKNDKRTLSKSCNNVWAIYQSDQRLQQILEYYPDTGFNDVEYIDIQTQGVPKYCDPRKWSVTNKESTEILQERTKEDS